MASENSSVPSYSSDSPLQSIDDDLFHRWPFAKRVAQVLRSRRDVASLVIGLYGTWGEGKTTVLNYIEQALESDAGVIVVRFNPWRFGEESVLIQQFFDTLAAAVGGKLTTRKEDFASTIEEYSSAVSIGAFGASFEPGQIAESYSKVDLEEARNRLEEILRDAGLRVVVRIDDIDRLTKHEIQAIFRLVKLSADFKNVAYVLAFDPDVVASALQEQFGTGRSGAGYDFLEKIVTVPLQLPPAQSQALLDICVEIVDEAIELAGVEMEDEGKRFLHAFHSGILPAINTPRMAKRYGNAVLFALPILVGEVDASDQLLVEGMRIVYPSLYEHIRAYPGIYLRNKTEDTFDLTDKEKLRKEREAEVDRIIAETVPDNISAATSLVDHLFPKARGNQTAFADLRREKRVGADWYFERYFTYAIPDDTVADEDFVALITFAEAEELSPCVDKILEMCAHSPSSERLAQMLNLHANSILIKAIPTLVKALTRVSEAFSEKRGFMVLSAQNHVASAIKEMVGRISDMSERQVLAESVVLEASSIKFAISFSGWASPQRSGKGKGILTEAGIAKLAKLIANRISEIAAVEPPHLSHPRHASTFYSVWAEGGGREAVSTYLSERLEEKPSEVIDLINSQLPLYISSNKEGAHPGEYSRDIYNSVSKYVDPEVLAEALAKEYPADVLEAGYADMRHVRRKSDGDDDVTVDQAAARQFMAIHRHAMDEERPAEKQTVDDENSPAAE